MKPALFPMLLAAVCAGPNPIPAAREAAPPVAVRPPAGLSMKVSPCPLPLPLKGTPVCTFSPQDGADFAPVLRLERITCNVNGQVPFVGAGPTPTLSLGMVVIEGPTAFAIRLLRTTAGQVRVVPDALHHPVLINGALFGLAHGQKRQALWREGVCEEPDHGAVRSFAPLADGGLVALLETWDRQQEVLHRDPDGHWSSWGRLPDNFSPTLHAENGRVSIQYQVQENGMELGVLFPDLGRTEVTRRWSTFPSRMPMLRVSPSSARAGSLFSPSVIADFDWESGQLTVDRPVAGSGSHRVLAATLKSVAGCRTQRGDFARPPKGEAFVLFSPPALAALDDATSLVAWVEERGSCEFKAPERAPQEYCPRCPGAPPPPPEWEPQITKSHSELVLLAVGRDVRELGRVQLGRKLPSIAGVSLAVTASRVFVQATGYFVELDRAALERR